MLHIQKVLGLVVLTEEQLVQTMLALMTQKQLKVLNSV